MSNSPQNIRKRKRTNAAANVTDMNTASPSTSPVPPRQLPPRRQYNELHKKDQGNKMNRKSRIESNWGVKIQYCIPQDIRPRVELKKGSKIRVGDADTGEEVWWNWSVEMLRALEELSTLTTGRLPVAQQLLLTEVTARQGNDKHLQRKVVELLLGDIQRVVDKVRHQNAQRMQTEDNTAGEEVETGHDMAVEESQTGSDLGLEESMMEPETADNPANYGENVNFQAQSPTPTPSQQGELQSLMLAPAAPHAPNHMITYAQGPAQATVPHLPPGHYQSPPQRSAHTSHLNGTMQVKVTEMRARALKLRAQAIRLEAEAVDLESEAAILRAQMDQA